MRYSIRFRPGARRALKRVPRWLLGRIDAAILSLAETPRPPGCKKLAGRKDLYRIRVGDFRVVYEVRDEVLVVMVVRIGPRGSVYSSM